MKEILNTKIDTYVDKVRYLDLRTFYGIKLFWYTSMQMMMMMMILFDILELNLLVVFF